MEKELSKDKIVGLMADQFKKRLSDPIELKLRATVEKWIIEDIGRVYDGTHSIKNPDLRSKSTLLLFKKRFEKARKNDLGFVAKRAFRSDRIVRGTDRADLTNFCIKSEKSL